jgi:hypothetical protein
VSVSVNVISIERFVSNLLFNETERKIPRLGACLEGRNEGDEVYGDVIYVAVMATLIRNFYYNLQCFVNYGVE